MQRALTILFCCLSLSLVMAKAGNFTQREIKLNAVQTKFLMSAIGAKSGEQIANVLQWGGVSHQSTLFQCNTESNPLCYFNGSFQDEETGSDSPVPQYTLQSDVIPFNSKMKSEWSKIFSDLGKPRNYFKKYEADDGIITVRVGVEKEGYRIKIGIDLRNPKNRASRIKIWEERKKFVRRNLLKG